MLPELIGRRESRTPFFSLQDLLGSAETIQHRDLSTIESSFTELHDLLDGVNKIAVAATKVEAGLGRG